MPPKPKITREMVIEAAFEVAREAGGESINARTVAKKLNCSTQPVMYHFATIEELKRAVYTKLDRYHAKYLMKIEEPSKGVMLGMGLNYIRFAREEPHLFRFLFQSNFFEGMSLLEMIDAEELVPVLLAMQGAAGVSIEQMKEIFLSIFLFVHGYAGIIANNSLKYNEEIIKSHLKRAYRGAILALQEEMK